MLQLKMFEYQISQKSSNTYLEGEMFEWMFDVVELLYQELVAKLILATVHQNSPHPCFILHA